MGDRLQRQRKNKSLTSRVFTQYRSTLLNINRRWNSPKFNSSVFTSASKCFSVWTEGNRVNNILMVNRAIIASERANHFSRIQIPHTNYPHIGELPLAPTIVFPSGLIVTETSISDVGILRITSPLSKFHNLIVLFSWTLTSIGS